MQKMLRARNENLFGAKEEEEKKLRVMFPEEIWLLILENIDDPDDLYQCAMASPFLNRLLQPKKNIYLLPQVLKLLDKRSFLKSSNSSDVTTISRSLLRCRLVCHGWKLAVNHFLEIRPFHFNCRQFPHGNSLLPHQALMDPAFYAQFRMYNFSYVRLKHQVLPQVKSFVQFDKKNTFSPSRHLHIREFRSRYVYNQYFRYKYHSVEAYRFMVKELLTKVGYHFWHLTIEMRDSLTIEDGHELVRNYLCHLPNLRSLYISWEKSDTLVTKINTYDSALHPFPKMSNLILVSFENAPVYTISAVLTANPHVKTVEITAPLVNKFSLSWYTVCENIFDLKCLSMEINNPMELEVLQQHWKLHYLRLNVKCTSVSFYTIFDTIRKYGDTLTELYLLLPKVESGMGKKSAWGATSHILNLPKLKKLTIYVFNAISIKFLAGLKSLEHLCLDVMHVEKTARSNNTGFFSGKDMKLFSCACWCCGQAYCKYSPSFQKNSHEDAEQVGNCNYSFHAGFEEDVWKLVPSLDVFDLRFNIEPPKTWKRPTHCNDV